MKKKIKKKNKNWNWNIIIPDEHQKPSQNWEKIFLENPLRIQLQVKATATALSHQQQEDLFQIDRQKKSHDEKLKKKVPEEFAGRWLISLMVPILIFLMHKDFNISAGRK